jgi:elongation factor P
MATTKIRDVKVGEAIRHDNEVWLVFDRHEQSRGRWRTCWQIKLKHLERGHVVEQRFSPDDDVEKLFLQRQEHQYLYRDADSYVFMDVHSFEQTFVPRELIPQEQRGLLSENLRLHLLMIQGRVIQVELPQTVEVEVIDAPEAARGDTATALTKLVTVETGSQVRVPGHIRKGDRIRLRVEDGEFRGRVSPRSEGG